MKKLLTRLTSRFVSFFELCIRFWGVTLAVVLLVVAGLIGSIYLQQKHWEASIDFALLELNTAIATSDMAVLIRRVDFSTLSRAAAMDIVENMEPTPVSAEGPVPPEQNRTNPRRIQWFEAEVQNVLLKLFTETPKPAGGALKKDAAAKEEIPVEQRGPMYDKAQEALAREAARVSDAMLRGEVEPPDPDTLLPPPVLPGDMLEQLRNTPFKLENVVGDDAAVSTRIKHPRAHMAVTLRLRARKTPTGWMFNRVEGLGQMARTYLDDLRAFNTYRESLFHARNAATQKLMDRTLKITECVAMLGAQHSDGSVNMIMRIVGKNTGDDAFTAASLQCSLYDAADQEVLRQPFGLVNVVRPGENFRIDFVQDYNADDPLAALLRKNVPLTCTSQIKSITLQRGKLLYIKPLSVYSRQ